jgi:hypothetical protein
MRGKYKNQLTHRLATWHREWLRRRVARLIDWEPLSEAETGCTAIMGACSKLPDVLLPNLRLLYASRWPELRRVIVVVDCEKCPFWERIEIEVRSAFPDLEIECLYYSASQAAFAESQKLPFIYAWLSWCIALKRTNTAHVLFQDYDALLLGPTLGERYRIYLSSGARVQGVTWYQNNGVEAEDRLATTFEAFMDTVWLRSSHPVALFNKLRMVEGRSIDFDITLDLQRLLSPEQRTIAPMKLEELVHPSQMIHQYTMFRRSPARVLPCFAMPMIPFFGYLSGRSGALDHAIRELTVGKRDNLNLLGDGTRINLSRLDIAHVDWSLKQIVEVCLAVSLVPDHKIYLYGQALYRVVGTPAEDIWRGDFNRRQRIWISAAAQDCVDMHAGTGSHRTGLAPSDQWAKTKELKRQPGPS